MTSDCPGPPSSGGRAGTYQQPFQMITAQEKEMMPKLKRDNFEITNIIFYYVPDCTPENTQIRGLKETDRQTKDRKTEKQRKLVN